MYDIYSQHRSYQNAKSIFFFSFYLSLLPCYTTRTRHMVGRQEELITIQYYQAGLQMCISREPSSRSPSRPVMAGRQAERAEKGVG